MNSISRNRVSKTMRDLARKSAEEEYRKIMDKYEKKTSDRVMFMFFLALSMVLKEQYGFGVERRAKVINEMSNQVNELSAFLYGNRCEDANGHEDFDIDYNRATLEKLSKEYGIKFDETIFDEVDYE